MSSGPERTLITSPSNPRIKEAAALRERRARQESGLFLVEGAREIGRALAAGWEADSAFVCDALMSAVALPLVTRLERTLKGRVCGVNGAGFEKLALRDGSDGLVVVFRVRTTPLEAAFSGERPLLLALHAVEKPGNLGALLRTADGVGATGVVILEGGCDPLSPQAIRASLGTVFSMPVAITSSAALLALGRERGVTFIAAALGTKTPPFAPWDLDLRGPVCLVLGAESQGLPELWLDSCDHAALIPMRGAADSLNVAAAGAMLLYEALRQRSG